MKRYKNYLIVFVFSIFCYLLTSNYLIGVSIFIIGMLDLLFFISKKEKSHLESTEKNKYFNHLCHQYIMDFKAPDAEEQESQFLDNANGEVISSWNEHFKKKIDRKLASLQKKGYAQFVAETRIKFWKFQHNQDIYRQNQETIYKNLWLNFAVTLLLVLIVRLFLSPLFQDGIHASFFSIVMILILGICGFFIHLLFIKELKNEETIFKIQ